MNGDEINDRLEFKDRIKKLPAKERSIETAMMVYDLKVDVQKRTNNGFSKRGTIISATTVTAVILTVLEFFKALFHRG